MDTDLRDWILDAAFAAVTAAEGGDLPPEWPDEPAIPADLGALCDLMWRAELFAARWRRVAAEMRGRLLGVLGGSHGFHDGQWAYRPSRKRHRFAADPARLLEWLGPDVGEVVNLSGADPVRITALRAVAARRFADLPEGERQGMVKVLEDSLFYTEWGEPELDRVRLDDKRCPRFIREAPPGTPIGQTVEGGDG